MKKFLFACIFAAVLLVSGSQPVSANGNRFSSFFSNRWNNFRHNQNNRNDHHDEKKKEHHRTPHHDKTIVSGTVYDGEGNPINGDQDFEKVTVVCDSKTEVVDIKSDGSYEASFSSSKCGKGDPVTVSAAAEQGTGSNTGTVQKDPEEGLYAELDIHVIDITVPEFGLIGGIFTGFASVAGYTYLKAKSTV